jgi:hypothetical protein
VTRVGLLVSSLSPPMSRARARHRARARARTRGLVALLAILLPRAYQLVA